LGVEHPTHDSRANFEDWELDLSDIDLELDDAIDEDGKMKTAIV
jgi:hypothetical protein